jgi:superfamily I DNA and RNA helicase
LSGLDQLERDEEFMKKLLTLLFKESKKYPIIKVAACPGPLEDNEHFKTLEAKRVLFFDTNSPEESLKNMFPELQTGEDETNYSPLQIQETGQKMTQEDEQTLIAAFVFLQGCQIYEKENDFLNKKIRAALEKEDISKLQEIHDDDKILEKIIVKVIEDVKKHEGDEINMNALEGLKVKSITQDLQTHSYLGKAHTKADKHIEAVDYLGIKYQLGNTYVLLDPIQQQIMDDKNPRQLILGSAGTGKTVLLQLKAWQLLEDNPKCKVLIILPLKGVVDVYKSYFKSAFEERLFIMTFREDWKKIIEIHSPHILIDEFAYIQVTKHLTINR